MVKKIFIIIGLLLHLACNRTKQPLTLGALFTDNMVLQQKKPVLVWGRGTPGRTVEVQLGPQRLKVKIARDGLWKIRLRPMPAGGPFELKVKAGKNEQIVLKNVLIGEVWLCSGQSNMEMPLKGWPPEALVENGSQEIARAHFPQIRLFTVPRNLSLTPEENIKSEWQICTPQHVENFSATAYFFGKKLHQALNVPIGLIHASWGGTPAEAWTETACLEAMDDFKDILEKLKLARPAFRKLKQWRAGLAKIVVPDLNDSTFWAQLDLNDAQYTDADLQGWSSSKLPGRWEENELGPFDGIVWYKKIIRLPENWVGNDLVLSLCPIDDMDRTYFNGQKVGGMEKMGYWQTPRNYVIPGKLVKERNVIAIRVIDTQGAGGLWGKADEMFLQLKQNAGQKINLAGQWYYLPVAEYENKQFYVYGTKGKKFKDRPELPLSLGPYTPGVLFNGMIRPLIPFTIRGVIWYQGEANVARPFQYRQLFPLLIDCWRQKWQQGDFPFYFVQIAPFDYGPEVKAQLLREAQLMALKVKNTGMVVTSDIGDAHNIHPAKKKEVGERLALWALAKNYGRNDLVFSGPIFKKAEQENGKMRIYFKFAKKGLLINRNLRNQFLIAGADKKFRPARVKV